MATRPNMPHSGATARRTAPKRDRRRWHRMVRLSPPEALLAAIPSYPRPMLERMADRIIDRLDQIDGDVDLEDDDDDMGVEDDPRGLATDEGFAFKYGIDQTLGPINAPEVWRKWDAWQRDRPL